jgi:hypothetical protein
MPLNKLDKWPASNSNTTRKTSPHGTHGRGQGENRTTCRGASIQEFQTPKGTTNDDKEPQTKKGREEVEITKETAERLAQRGKELKATNEELERHQQAALENRKRMMTMRH